VTLPDLQELAAEDERLRGVAADPAAVEDALARAEEQLGEAEGGAALRLHTYVGNAHRLLGRHAEAIAAHGRARELAVEQGDRRAFAAALARLGESYRCAGRLAEAEATLREALEASPREFRHFPLQHLGKALLDRGRVEEAEAVLEEALRLRRAAGDRELVASTERALAAARSRP
jgi:tetratricopeptide (TPR) repeat protein